MTRRHHNKFCPACGLHLGYEPWQGESASDQICDCCGIQFGYDDAAGGNLERRLEIYAAWRRKWKASGMKWWSTESTAPENWDPEKQLQDAGLEP